MQESEQELLGKDGEQKPKEIYNLLNDPYGADFVLSLIFTQLPLEFVGVLCCVNGRWCQHARDSSWKPELLLYSWGEGEHCGHGGETFVGSPSLLHHFYSPYAHEQICSVACSDFVTLALTAGGAVYRWGQVTRDQIINVPERMTALEKHPVAQISVTCPGYFHGRLQAEYHAAACAEDGSFWMWGGSQHAQLFLEDISSLTEAARGVPLNVDFFRRRGEQVVQFSCGVQITVVQTRDRHGRTRVHEAGREHGNWRWQQQLHALYSQEVPELQDLPIKQLVCGGFFTCAVSSTGELWTWGSSHGPDRANGSLLGRGQKHHNNDGRVSPGVVQNLPMPVRHVACSTYTALAVLQDGSVFTWGDCDGSALGHHETRCHLPHPLHLQVTDLDVEHASLAYTNGAIASRDGRIFMWGGREWENGISSETASDDGMPRELTWNGVALGYRCANLILGHSHAYIIARKLIQ
eukprot:gnl/MRDRNA2_/MRDRNA2_98631_c0_seq1.p1 gnl/MRDRNA2_/MRDRNA2_98631_c0~~gnl/MRDRNA2_/MRDRNA2_98631_c0_seq1.p1  ORF type:complete len:465 (+),score=73.83 gnl/MRDRNA2_/MRDRNA2_98631_c0_seq1:105-1499(+)